MCFNIYSHTCIHLYAYGGQRSMTSVSSITLYLFETGSLMNLDVSDLVGVATNMFWEPFGLCTTPQHCAHRYTLVLHVFAWVL